MRRRASARRPAGSRDAWPGKVLGVGVNGPLGVMQHAPLSPPPEREALIALSTVEGLGPATLARLLARLGSAQNIFDVAARPNAIRELVQANADADGTTHAMPDAVAHDIVEVAANAAAVLAGLVSSGVEILTIDDPDYPMRLRSIDLPPHVLYVRGDPAALAPRHAIAIVGTRRPTEAGRLTASRLGAAIARAGGVVVSGLAVGIDGAAHAAVVQERRATVAVLGGGHDHLFPTAHRRLAAAIVASGGAIVSEFPPATEPLPGLFPRRNRIISGLSDATVVVEAGASSGALITATWALEQGRECFLVPGSIDSPSSAGCLSFLREFPAQARIVAGIPQLIADLELVDEGGIDAIPVARSVAAVLVGLDPGPRRIATALLAGRTTADELVAATGLTIAGVLAALTLLESRELVAGAYGRYRPVGDLASATPRRRPRRSPRRDPGGTTLPASPGRSGAV
jgi:DNA processing protein